MNKQDLYALDEIVYKRIQEERRKETIRVNAYFDGMEVGADMMMKCVRDYLTEEAASGERNGNG